MSTLRDRWTPLATLPLAQPLVSDFGSTLLHAHRLVGRVLEGEGPTIRVDSERMPVLIAALRPLGLRELDEDRPPDGGDPPYTVRVMAVAPSGGTTPREEALVVLGWRPLDKRALTNLLRTGAGLELGVVQRLRGRVLRGQVVDIDVPPGRE